MPSALHCQEVYFGTSFALLLAPFCAGGMDFSSVFRRFLRILIQILRSFPTLILTLTATFLFGLGTFAGTIAITLYTFAIMTRLTYEDIENAPRGPYRALSAMGVSPFKAYFAAVIPEISPAFFANGLYLLETNVRHSSILGYVGAGGIGTLLIFAMNQYAWEKAGDITLGLILLVWAVDLVSSALRRGNS